MDSRELVKSVRPEQQKITTNKKLNPSINQKTWSLQKSLLQQPQSYLKLYFIHGTSEVLNIFKNYFGFSQQIAQH